MKISRLLAASALIATVGLPAASQTFDFTAAEGFTDGLLTGQLGFDAQNNFVVDSTAGVVTTDSGAFVRFRNNDTLGLGDANGDTITVSTQFSFNGDFGLRAGQTAATANFAQGTYVVGLTENIASVTPSLRFSSGIYLAGDGTSLELQAGTGGSAVGIGAATDFDGDLLELIVTYTRLGADTFSVDAALNNVTDATSFSTANASVSNAALVTGLAGGLDIAFQTLPSAGTAGSNNAVYDGVTISSVSIVPEPASLALIGLGGLAMLGRRRKV